MGQVAIKSASVTNANAIPRTQNTIGIDGGRITRAVHGLCTLTTGDSAAATLAAGASTYRFGRIRSSDYVDTMRLVTTADAGTTTVVDIGLYDVLTSTNGGAVVDQTYFASSFSLKSVWEKRLAVEVIKLTSTLRRAMALPGGRTAMERRKSSQTAITLAATAMAGWENRSWAWAKPSSGALRIKSR